MAERQESKIYIHGGKVITCSVVPALLGQTTNLIVGKGVGSMPGRAEIGDSMMTANTKVGDSPNPP